MLSTLQTLIKAIHHAPSADNSQPWHINWDNHVLSVSYDSKRVEGSTFSSDHPATLLTIGACMENLKQASEAIEIDFKCHISSNFNSCNPIYFQLPIEKSRLNKKTEIDTLPLFDRHTNRLPYLKRPIPSDLVEVLKKLTVAEARVMVLEESSDIKNIAELVRKASEIRFRTREINEWLGKSLRFKDTSGEKNDGLDVATLDLPPGGSAFLRLIGHWRIMKFLNLFGVYKAMSTTDAQPVSKAPALVAIISPSGFQDVLAAGQLMDRIWIELNAHGLAVHPYYVVTDQLHRRQEGVIPKGLEKQADFVFEATNRLFQFNDGETLQMLFRVGYPKKNAVRSKRISMDKVCSGINFISSELS